MDWTVTADYFKGYGIGLLVAWGVLVIWRSYR